MCPRLRGASPLSETHFPSLSGNAYTARHGFRLVLEARGWGDLLEGERSPPKAQARRAPRRGVPRDQGRPSRGPPGHPGDARAAAAPPRGGLGALPHGPRRRRVPAPPHGRRLACGRRMTQATPSVDSPEVLDRFYAHLSLVDILAAQLVRTLRGPVQLDDLVSAGREGLLDVARRYDPTHGTSFK